MIRNQTTPTSSPVPMAAIPRASECAGTVTPLDFSFLNITTIIELENETPREQAKRKVQKVVVPATPEEMSSKDYREKYKYNSHCLRLNNNLLTEMGTFVSILYNILEEPLGITWLDMSFNELTTIEACFCDLKSLQILYLHGNHINDIAEVNKLRGMPQLYKLTTHGNPLDTYKGYRNYMLKNVPQLRNLDFSLVTRSDRANAEGFRAVKPPKKKTKAED